MSSKHLHGKIRTELRNAKAPKGQPPISSGVIPSASVFWNRLMTSWSSRGMSLRIQAGQVLQHTDHGRIIVSENIQLQQVVVDGVVIKMGRDDVRGHIVGRMLHRRKGMDLLARGAVR